MTILFFFFVEPIGTSVMWRNFEVGVEINTALLLIGSTSLSDWSNKHVPLSHNQSDSKLNPNTTWSTALSRASRNFLAFASSSHWLLLFYCFVLIGSCDYFGLVLC